jgi:hypothetical protein
MTLARFIYHKVVGTPTYFDVLPVDVLRCGLIPFLGWEDRIHLNMMTPPGDRTPPDKIAKDRIIAHQMKVTDSLLASKAKTRELAFDKYLSRGFISLAYQSTYIDALKSHIDAKVTGHALLHHLHSRRFKSLLEDGLDILISRSAHTDKVYARNVKDLLATQGLTFEREIVPQGFFKGRMRVTQNGLLKNMIYSEME